MVLVIEDNAHERKTLEYRLKEDFHVLHAVNGLDGLKQIYQHQPDLVLLDLTMPTMDGTTTCHRIREVSDIPIIVLTADSDPDRIVELLQIGADDYIVKPYQWKVLLARMIANLRRASAQPFKSHVDLSYTDAHLTIDIERHRIVRDGELIHLSPTQFKLLGMLLEASPRIVPYRILLENVWGFEYIDEIERLRVFIHQLRKNIEPSPNNPVYIKNEPGHGYFFDTSLH
jgi:DNA-binding response OmpR family regulator